MYWIGLARNRILAFGTAHQERARICGFWRDTLACVESRDRIGESPRRLGSGFVYLPDCLISGVVLGAVGMIMDDG